MEAASIPARAPLERTRRRLDRFGDTGLYVLAGLASLFAMAVIAAIVWKVVETAWPAIRHSGIGFVWHSDWNPVTDVYGAREYIIGTLVTATGAMVIAAPLAIAIGLF